MRHGTPSSGDLTHAPSQGKDPSTLLIGIPQIHASQNSLELALGIEEARSLGILGKT